MLRSKNRPMNGFTRFIPKKVVPCSQLRPFQPRWHSAFYQGFLSNFLFLSASLLATGNDPI